MWDFGPYPFPKPEPILRDVFTGWELGDGIFNALSNLSNELPWADASGVDSTVLDIAYFGNRSGGKFCAPLVKFYLDDNDEIPNAARVTIAKILLTKYLPNWKRLWDTNVVAYSPIHNYDMTESRTRKTANSEAETINENQTHTGTDTFQHGKVETVDHGRTSEELTSRYGLNTDTSDPKPSDKVTNTEGGETVTTDSGSDVDTKNLADSRLNNRNMAGAEQEEEEVHRAGNIGVTTTQKLIQEERELWVWNYFDQVFTDIDRELALSVYDPCRV